MTPALSLNDNEEIEDGTVKLDSCVSQVVCFRTSLGRLVHHNTCAAVVTYWTSFAPKFLITRVISIGIILSTRLIQRKGQRRALVENTTKRSCRFSPGKSSVTHANLRPAL